MLVANIFQDHCKPIFCTLYPLFKPGIVVLASEFLAKKTFKQRLKGF
ncbi:MAG: hypothetical protein OFPII_16760 [Osedax symbiont Rs1]|nr:MAG: hypothetical protein OFPII_16760 [Osedax symbiont Rs1]